MQKHASLNSSKTWFLREPLDSCFLHHDIAPAHWAFAMQGFLKGIELQLLEHPAYSRDLAPCDFGLFPYIRLRMKGRHFSSFKEFIAAFQEECNLISKEMWGEWFEKWFRRIKKYIKCD